MADNKDAIALALVTWVQNLFSAEPNDIRLFLDCWDEYINFYKDTESNVGNKLENLVGRLKKYAEEKYNISSKKINNNEF